MKILLAHSFYGSTAPSGENFVYLAERDLLRQQGHEVLEFTRHSDDLRSRGMRGNLQGAVMTPWNRAALSQLRELLRCEKPDVLHVHNTFPALSPAIYRAARGTPTATVLTLHNYRCFCAAGIPMRRDQPCTLCLDRQSVLPALKHGCYRDSHLATLPMALMIALHRAIRTWQRDVDAFIALTGFQRDLLAKAGLPHDAIHVKPHFYPNPPTALPWDEREGKVVFLGRLRIEKGLQHLLEAWKLWGNAAPRLDIIGDGEEGTVLKRQAEELRLQSHVQFVGQIPFENAQDRLARARLLVLPSLCFEGFPMVLREAFALGVPVAASRIGAIPHIVTDGEQGVLFEPGDATDLHQTVRRLWETPHQLATMGKTARAEFERKYTAEQNHEMLMAIYEAAIARRAARGSSSR